MRISHLNIFRVLCNKAGSRGVGRRKVVQGTGECQKKKGRIKGRGKDGRKEVEEKESR